jgi:hypothetical protein
MLRFGERFERAPAAEVGEETVGDERAVVLPDRLALAEEVVQQRIGGLRERPDLGDRLGEPGDLVRPRSRDRVRVRARELALDASPSSSLLR